VNEGELERAYQEVLSLLRDKYNIQNHSPWLLFSNNENIEKLRKETNSKLREALYDVFLTQACEDF
jgi:hypothetical protein